MLISHIRLKNWKNFKEVEASLESRVFLIGPNASGKSNFLDALRFLRDIADSGLAKAVTNREGISAIRCLAATRYTNVDIDVTVSGDQEGEWRYELSINQDTARRPVVRKELRIEVTRF